MALTQIQRSVAVALTVSVLLPNALGAPTSLAASSRQAPPPGINAALPAVVGRLVAKATGKSSPSPVSCGGGMAAPNVMVRRGLVICTDTGTFVLLQLSPPTRIFNRGWTRIGYGRLALGDRLAAWGTLRAGGTQLSPTAVIQDLSRGGEEPGSVTGTLVAKPNEPPTGRVLCGNQDVTGTAQTAISRGLVVCTAAGKLVLFQLSSTTRVLTRDRATVRIEDLSLGDRVIGRGTVQDAGLVLNPTVSVVDTNLLGAGTNSQDFIAGDGNLLTLYVLSSQPGPVKGRVGASAGEPARVTLCNGSQGTWADLKMGQTIDIRHSIFNTRTMRYVDTSIVQIVSCG